MRSADTVSGRDRERRAARGDQAANLLGLQQRRCAAAEEDRVGVCSIAGTADLCLERIDITALEIALEESAVEVAVVADVAAERDVQVKAQRRRTRDEGRGASLLA